MKANEQMYWVESSHTIEKNDYEQGITDYVNSYDLNDRIIASSPKEAIKKYFEGVLCFDYNEEFADFGEEWVSYNVLVDADNMEATEQQIEQWKKGEIELYNDFISIWVYKMNLELIK